MNQISTLQPAIEAIEAVEERVDGIHASRAVADDLEYGRHAAPIVRDPGDYVGKHR